MRLNAKITRVERNGGGKLVCYETQGKEETLAVDEILAGAGRAPNVEGLNLEAVGVQYDPRKGVLVNDCLQTTQPAHLRVPAMFAWPGNSPMPPIFPPGL